MRTLRLLYLIVLAVVIVWLVVTRWDEVVELTEGARVGFLAASLVSSFGMIIIGAWFWVVGLRTLGHDAPFGLVTRATARTVMARYLPGSVWFAVGRVALLRQQGLPGGPLAATALLEMALSLGTVLAFGFALLGFTDALPGGVGLVLLAVGFLIAAASPPAGGRALAWLARRRGTRIELTWRGYGTLLAMLMLFWAWSAMTFLLYLRAFPAGDPVGVVLAAGGFMVAWGVGFLSVVAPQGIGVFEVGLATIYDIDAVASFAVVAGGYRLVLLARDLISTALSEVTPTRRADRGSAPTG